jgi:hypothetical protein
VLIQNIGRARETRTPQSSAPKRPLCLMTKILLVADQGLTIGIKFKFLLLLWLIRPTRIGDEIE